MPKQQCQQDYICASCGRIVKYYEHRLTGIPDANTDTYICYDCRFWFDAAINPKPNFQVINGQYFYFPPIIKKGYKVKHILTIDGEIISSTELFNHGHIPERFKHLFKTTAHFISYHVWKSIEANKGFQCRKIGCWDRMVCLWFNHPVKDWNEIPSNHKIGSECCPQFINKLNPNV